MLLFSFFHQICEVDHEFFDISRINKHLLILLQIRKCRIFKSMFRFLTPLLFLMI